MSSKSPQDDYFQGDPFPPDYDPHPAQFSNNDKIFPEWFDEEDWDEDWLENEPTPSQPSPAFPQSNWVAPNPDLQAIYRGQILPQNAPSAMSVQALMIPPIGRKLPPSTLTHPAPADLPHKIPTAGVLLAGVWVMAIGVSATSLLGAISGLLATASLFAGAVYCFVLMYHLLKQNHLDEQYNRAIEREFAPPYTRYRVYPKAEGAEVVLQLTAWEAQHQPGQAANYETRVVEERRVRAGEDIAAFETLAELQEAAETYEQKALEGWTLVEAAQELEEQLLGQLSRGSIPSSKSYEGF